MNSLIITAHPNPKGFTHDIAKAYQKKCEKKGGKAEILDLYQTPFQQSYLLLNEQNKNMPDQYREILQEKISDADELVFVYPLRWFDCPAIMKNFLDTNFCLGFAYCYNSNGREKMLTGKTAKVFFTAGGPRRVYLLMRPIFYIIWGQGRMGFVGIKLTSLNIYAGFGKNKSAEDRQKILDNIEK